MIAKLRKDLLIALTIALGIAAGGFLLSSPDSERVQATASTPAVVRFNDAALRVDAEEKTQADQVEWYSTAEFVNAANFAQALLDDAAHDREVEAQRAREAAKKHSASVARPADGGERSGACGGNLPPCYVLHRESHGDPRIWNGQCYAPIGWTGKSPCGKSSASGLWQFVRDTWGGYGGCLNAADCPASVQNERAVQVWAGGAGCSNWGAC